MRDIYVLGLDILGADPKRAYVIARNAAVYGVNFAAGDDQAAHIGDNEAAFVLQPGAAVDVVDEAVKNARGVSYTPVTVPGKDGAFFIRASDLGYEKAKPAFVSAATAPRAVPRDLEAEENDRLRSVALWTLGIVGAVAAAIGVYHVSTNKPARRVHA